MDEHVCYRCKKITLESLTIKSKFFWDLLFDLFKLILVFDMLVKKDPFGK